MTSDQPCPLHALSALVALAGSRIPDGAKSKITSRLAFSGVLAPCKPKLAPEPVRCRAASSTFVQPAGLLWAQARLGHGLPRRFHQL